MSELPPRLNSAATTRRRHNYTLDLSSQEEQTVRGGHSLVSFANNQINITESNTARPTGLKPKAYIATKETKSNQPTPSSSFSNFSSLIATPASQIWSSAQNSIQAFATAPVNQYAQPAEYPEYNTFNQQDQDFTPSFHSIEMPFRDRTQEFRTVSKSCQLKYQANGLHNKEEREKIIRSSVQFNQLARRIGRDLSLTCAKMEKLTQLAKKKSLFDDRAGEVEELSHIIKQDITGLNKQIANLQEVIKKRSAVNNQRQHQGQDHSKLVVVGLQSKLVSVSKNFQNVLEKCTENLKIKKNRRDKFSQASCVPSNLPPSASAGNMGSLLLHDDAMASGSSSVAVDMDRVEQHRMQEQLSLIDESDSYHRDRYNAMENIESSISELGTIFGQLASLVAEQGEMITRIDSNVEETSINVDAAHHELLKYFTNISRNRWLIIKVFGVLMAFFVFFVIFLT